MSAWQISGSNSSDAGSLVFTRRFTGTVLCLTDRAMESVGGNLFAGHRDYRIIRAAADSKCNAHPYLAGPKAEDLLSGSAAGLP